MRATFKKLEVKDLSNLEHLVAENIEGIESGLRVVDSRVCLGQAAIDLIALDARESLVLVALDFIADEGLLLRAMDACSWCLEYHDTLRRLYPMAKVSSACPPRILFVVERVTDAFVRRMKQLSFLEIDCLEFRHLEVNGASAVYFHLVERLRRAAPVEPTSGGERTVTTVPVWTAKRIVAEPPVAERAWPQVAEPRGLQPSAATPTTAEPGPFAPERSAIAAATWAAPENSGLLGMAELFGRQSAAEMPSEAEMPTESYATEEAHEGADADVVNADVVAAEPSLQLEPVDATAHQETQRAPSVPAGVAASPEWEALLSRLGVATEAPTRAGGVKSTGRAAEAPAESPVETSAAAAEPPVPAAEQPAPAAVETAASAKTQPVWTKPSADKVVPPSIGRTYFFSQAAKGTTAAEAQAPKPAAVLAPAPATPTQKTAAPAQRISSSAQQTVAPVPPRPAARARPPVAPAAPTAAPVPQATAMAATKVDATKPKELDPSRPELESLNFPKDGLSRQWLEFLNQLGGAK